MRLVYGVGINDKKGFSSSKEYRLWADMLRRCYTENPIKRQACYQVCTVSENFKSFSYFYDWCQNQIGFNKNGFQLDKDVILKGNLTYSEDLCVFIHRDINGCLEKCKKSRGLYPIGVYLNSQSGLFSAVVRKKSTQIFLGYFKNPHDAFNAYKDEKESHIRYLAKKFKDQIDPRAYKALMIYKVEITD